MTTFDRYFVHFFGLSSIIMLVFIGLLFIDKSELLQPVALLAMFGCVLLYSVPMALLYNNIGQEVVVKLDNNIDEKDIEKLENMIINKYKRRVISESGNRREFKMESRYKAWLTNPIIIEEDKGVIYIKAPQMYAKEIEIEFSKYIA